MAAHQRGRFLYGVTVLAVLLGVVTAGAWSAVGDGDNSDERSAMSLLRVYTQAPSLLGGDAAVRAPAQDGEVFRNTMANLFKSHFVIEAAIRPQQVAEIEQIRSLQNPVEWIRENLDVSFLENSEIMRVRLSHPSMTPVDLERLVDSLVDAFMREVVDSERLENVRKRDVLQRQFTRAEDELNQTREEFIGLAEELGGADSPTAQLQTEMLLENWRANRAERRELEKRVVDSYLQRQLEFVEAGAYELSDQPLEDDPNAEPNENEPATRPSGEREIVAVDEQELDEAARQQLATSRTRYAVVWQVCTARLQALEDEASKMNEEMKKHARVSAELQQRRDDLQRQAELVDTLGQKLALWNVEESAGSRIIRLQPAVFEGPRGE